MDAQPVSVVVPTYRRSRFLERALRSVVEQTHDAWELIIVDDNGDADPHQQRTLERVRPFLEDRRVRYVAHERNRGGSAARNTGIRTASADYVAFLDDDDEWHPEFLARQLDAFRDHDADVALVCAPYVQVGDPDGEIVVRPRLVDRLDRELLMRNVVGPTSCVTCRRDALVEVGGFDEELPAMQDLDLYARLAMRYRFVAIDVPLVRYHLHDAGSIGRDLTGSAAARRAFDAKYRHLIEVDPEVRRYRLEESADIHFRANQPVEAAKGYRALLRSRPHRVDFLIFFLLARLGLCEETTRARHHWGAFRTGLWRRLRRRRVEGGRAT